MTELHDDRSIIQSASEICPVWRTHLSSGSMANADRLRVSVKWPRGIRSSFLGNPGVSAVFGGEEIAPKAPIGQAQKFFAGCFDDHCTDVRKMAFLVSILFPGTASLLVYGLVGYSAATVSLHNKLLRTSPKASAFWRRFSEYQMTVWTSCFTRTCLGLFVGIINDFEPCLSHFFKPCPI